MSLSPYRKAKRRVRRKKGFYYHFTVYFCINAFLFAINMLTEPWDYWFVFPLLAWGIAIAIHYVSVFGIPGTDLLTKEWEEKEMDKEMRKYEYMERKNFERTNVATEPFEELEIDEELELKDFKNLRKEWDDSEFV